MPEQLLVRACVQLHSMLATSITCCSCHPQPFSYSMPLYCKPYRCAQSPGGLQERPDAGSREEQAQQGSEPPLQPAAAAEPGLEKALPARCLAASAAVGSGGRDPSSVPAHEVPVSGDEEPVGQKTLPSPEAARVVQVGRRPSHG